MRPAQGFFYSPLNIFTPLRTINLMLLLVYVMLQLQCCGIEGPKDWDKNNYFNCSSHDVGSREACGVPFSCCRRKPNVRSFLSFFLAQLFFFFSHDSYTYLAVIG